MTGRYQRIFLLLLLFPVLLKLSGQTRIITQTIDFHKKNQQILADVKGFILINNENGQQEIMQNPYDSVTPFPGWPMTQNGESKRGSVICNMDSDNELEILYCIGSGIYAWNPDGTYVTGWPVTIQNVNDGPPAVGDITGNGQEEIVVSTRTPATGNEGVLFAFNKDGSLVNGFPVTMLGGAVNHPVLADLNNDGIFEIILEERNWPKGFVSVYSGDGSLLPGWPVELDDIPASAVAVGDITGDSIPEIIAESYISLYVFDVEGNILTGFPFTPGNFRVFSYSTPVLADMDGDGFREIIFGDHSTDVGYGLVYVLNNDGTLLPGWPTNTANWIYCPVSIADIDYDGSLDIITGDQVVSGTPWCHVYAWDNEGNFKDGWPTSYIWSVHAQVMIMNLDGDKFPEVVCDDNTNEGRYLAFNHDGSLLDGWSVYVEGTTFFINPVFGDVNNNGLLDFTGGGLIPSIPQTSVYLWESDIHYEPEKAFLPVFQYNNRHDGVYKLPEGFLFAAFEADNMMPEPGQDVEFTNKSLGEVISWEWFFEGGIPEVSTQPDPVVLYPDTGKFDVRLVVFDGIKTDTAFEKDYISVGFATLVEEVSHFEGVGIYPNPCRDMLFLKPGNLKGTEVKLTIYDRTGKVYLKKTFTKSHSIMRISTQSLPSGLYLVEATSGYYSIWKKLVKL
ncbi:MAG: FG-GAP-like repeat-containing protein [Bacteroidales bacterium]|nr:FG-GAP-like repeat-containing protein [Bacteroidales bacterium]